MRTMPLLLVFLAAVTPGCDSDPCSDLNDIECVNHPECGWVQARMVHDDENPPCTSGQTIPVGCLSVDTDCADMTMSAHAPGETGCWFFQSMCIPEGWETDGCDEFWDVSECE